MNENGLFSYLFIVDSTQLSLPEALKTVDKVSQIENWQTVLPDAAVLISRLNIKQLHEVLKDKFDDLRYLLILLEKGKKAGWLAKKSWKFMNYPTSVVERDFSHLEGD